MGRPWATHDIMALACGALMNHLPGMGLWCLPMGLQWVSLVSHGYPMGHP